tara:strand:- start:166 stop:279 length:114 start_codon:yes stop_codon:yes gene_type:complete
MQVIAREMLGIVDNFLHLLIKPMRFIDYFKISVKIGV